MSHLFDESRSLSALEQDKPEAVEQMIERLAGDRHAQAAHVGKIRQPEPAGFVKPTKDNLLLFAVDGAP